MTLILHLRIQDSGFLGFFIVMVKFLIDVTILGAVNYSTRVDIYDSFSLFT